MKRIAVITAIIFLTLGLLAVAWQLRMVVLVFIVSQVIAATLHGPIERLMEAGLGHRVAIFAVYLLAAGFIALLSTVAFMPMISETNLLVIDLTQGYNELRFYLSSVTGTHIDLLASVLPTDEQFTEGVEMGALTPALRQTVGITQNIGTLLGQFLLAFVLSIYWTVDRTRFERLWLSLLAPEQRAQTRIILRRLTDDVGAYIRSELLQMVLVGALLTLGFWIAGLKYPFTAALLAALAWLLPLIGGFVALLPVLLIGWLSGLQAMGLAIFYTISILLVMELQVEHKLFSRQRYWGVLVVFVMLALGSEFGLIGLIIAPPTAVALQIIIDAFVEPSPRPAPHTTDLPALRQRLAEIEDQLTHKPGTYSHRLKNLAVRLKTITTESEAIYSSEDRIVEDSNNETEDETAADVDENTGAVNTTQ